MGSSSPRPGATETSRYGRSTSPLCFEALPAAGYQLRFLGVPLSWIDDGCPQFEGPVHKLDQAHKRHQTWQLVVVRYDSGQWSVVEVGAKKPRNTAPLLQPPLLTSWVQGRVAVIIANPTGAKIYNQRCLISQLKFKPKQAG